jgi:hypothetical protein
LARLQQTDGFRLVAIGTGQTEAEMKAVVAGRQLDMLTVGDGMLKLTRHWGVTCWPTGILIDSRGLVQSVQFGKRHAGGLGRPDAGGAVAEQRRLPSGRPTGQPRGDVG